MASDGLVISKMMDVTVVNFSSGSILDSASVEKISKSLYALVDEKAIRKMVLDMSNVKFLSSQMLGALIALHKKATNIKGKFFICGLRADLMKVFKITQLDKILSFTDTEEQALNKFGVALR